MVKEDVHALETMLQYENNNSLFYCSSFNPLWLWVVVIYYSGVGLPLWLRGKRVCLQCSSIPESGRSFEGGHGNPLQYSCLENPMDRRAWRAIVHRTAKSWTIKKAEHQRTDAFELRCWRRLLEKAQNSTSQTSIVCEFWNSRCSSWI